MKKLLLAFLVFILSGCILCACNQNEIDETSFPSADTSQTEQTSVAESSSGTEQTEPPALLPQSFVSPADEIKITKTFTGVNEYGMRMNISIQGYASESLGMGFYLKSNEENAFEFTLTNDTGADVWQFSACLTDRFYFDVEASEQGGQIIDLYYTDMKTFMQEVSCNEFAFGEAETQKVRLWSADWQSTEENVRVRSGIIIFPYRLTHDFSKNTHDVSIELSYTEVFVSGD